MASLDPLHPIHSALLEVLAAHPRLDVQELHAALREYGESVSLPNLYRVIGQMIDVQMLVRDNGKIAISRAWIPHILSIADTIRSTYATADGSNFPLKENERREFTAESLGGLDPIWFDILIGCADADLSREWFAYNSHPWHVIGMSDTELRGYKAIVKKGITCQMSYGSETFLDLYGKKIIRIPGFKAVVSPSVPFLKEGYALWVCGEYIIECVFPDSLSKRFTYFFDTIKTIKQFEPSLFVDIFQMKARCKVTLRRNKKEAEKLRSLLKKHT